MSVINTAEMQVNQSARLMDTITIVKVNDKEFILSKAGDKMKKGVLPFHTDVTLLNKHELEQSLLRANHSDDWYSLMLAELIRTKILPKTQ